MKKMRVRLAKLWSNEDYWLKTFVYFSISIVAMGIAFLIGLIIQSRAEVVSIPSVLLEMLIVILVPVFFRRRILRWFINRWPAMREFGESWLRDWGYFPQEDGDINQASDFLPESFDFATWFIHNQQNDDVRAILKHHGFESTFVTPPISDSEWLQGQLQKGNNTVVIKTVIEWLKVVDLDEQLQLKAVVVELLKRFNDEQFRRYQNHLVGIPKYLGEEVALILERVIDSEPVVETLQDLGWGKHSTEGVLVQSPQSNFNGFQTIGFGDDNPLTWEVEKPEDKELRSGIYHYLAITSWADTSDDDFNIEVARRFKASKDDSTYDYKQDKTRPPSEKPVSMPTPVDPPPLPQPLRQGFMPGQGSKQDWSAVIGDDSSDTSQASSVTDWSAELRLDDSVTVPDTSLGSDDNNAEPPFLDKDDFPEVEGLSDEELAAQNKGTGCRVFIIIGILLIVAVSIVIILSPFGDGNQESGATAEPIVPSVQEEVTLEPSGFSMEDCMLTYEVQSVCDVLEAKAK